MRADQSGAEQLALSQAAVEQLAQRLVDALVPRLADALGPAVAEQVRLRLQPEPPRELAQLVRDAHARYGDAVWAVCDLRALGLVAPADTDAIGRALGKLWRQGGRVRDLALVRVTDRAGRDGHEYKVVLAGCDDAPSSPLAAADTMAALQRWSHKR